MKTVILVLISICMFSCSTAGTGLRKLASVKEIPFLVTNNSYSLSGQINDVEGSKTVAIFFHGSGVHDRWETMPAELTLTKKPEPFFKPISEALNRQGISTVVFDKRAYAEKGKPEFEKVIKTFTFENIKADAKTIVSYVNQLNRFEKIILIGHSEGTVTASEISFDLKNNKKITELILISVLAENLKTSLYHQLTDVMANNTFKLADINQDGKIYIEEIPDSLKPGLPIDKIDKDKKGYIVYNDLLAILTTQADGLIMAINEAPAETIISGKPVQWYRDLFNRKTLLDRAKEYSIPVLIAHGELDQNVFFKTNALALDNKLLSLKKEVTLKSFPNYGHCLSPQSDGLPNLGPIEKDAVGDIVNWSTSNNR